MTYGGNWGTKIGLGRVRDQLAVPLGLSTPLGAVSSLVTEQVGCFLDGPSTPPDDHLLKGFLGSLLRGKLSDFFSTLWKTSRFAKEQSREAVIAGHIVHSDMRALIASAVADPSLFPLAMAVTSIHSAEFFRECLLAYTGALHASSSEHASSPGLHSILLLVIKIFASTSHMQPDSLITPEILRAWPVYLALVGSLMRHPVREDSAGARFLFLLGRELVKTGETVPGHICVITSGLKPQLDSVDAPGAVLCLLGADHRKNFARMLDPHVIVFTEILEYIQRTKSGDFFFPALVPFKYAFAEVLAGDLGMMDVAEKYLQVVGGSIRALPANRFSPHLRAGVRELESRILEAVTPGSVKPPRGLVSDVGSALWGSLRTVIDATI